MRPEDEQREGKQGNKTRRLGQHTTLARRDELSKEVGRGAARVWESKPTNTMSMLLVSKRFEMPCGLVAASLPRHFHVDGGEHRRRAQLAAAAPRPYPSQSASRPKFGPAICPSDRVDVPGDTSQAASIK